MLSRAQVLLDACVLINLAATGRAPELLRVLAPQCWIAKAAADESLYLRPLAEGDKPESLDLPSLLAIGAIEVKSLESEVETDLYVANATELDDGEAMSVALAASRSAALASDDRKTRRFVEARFPTIPLFSTAEIVHAWAPGKPAAEVKHSLRLIEIRARYRPAPGDPLADWWATAAGR
ncbi:MAG TPA: hypothetical protein VNF74_08965 [Terriglobales bacterium]|nr:hypothetical protein [Terriglobales bacterium]